MRRVAFWLSLALFFATPWENAVFLTDIGATGTRLLGLGVAMVWIASVLITGRYRKPQTFHLVIFLFVIWSALSMIWSVDPDLTSARLQTYLQLFVMVLLIWDLYTTTDAVNAGLQAYILGAYVSILSIVFSYRNAIGAEYARLSGSGFNANDLALVLALGIPIAWHLALTAERGRGARFWQLMNYAYLPAATLAIFLTASRGTLIAAVPGFIFVIWSLRRLRPASRVLTILVLLTALFVLQPLVPQTSLQRLATIGASISQGDLSGRVEIWRDGMSVFMSHPVGGVGSGAFTAAIPSGFGPHNSFVSVLTETGLIGFLLFAMVMAWVAYATMRQPKWISRMWLTVLMIWVLGSISHGWEQRKPTWLFAGFAVASAGLVVRRDESIQSRTRRLGNLDSRYGTSKG